MRALRMFVAALSIIATSASNAQITANTVTFTFPGCELPVISGTGPDYMVGCSGLACQATASPMTQVPGSAVQLAVACDPLETNVVWRASAGCTNPPGGRIVEVSEAAGPKVCTDTATATGGTKNGIASVTVDWSAGGSVVTKPGQCTIDGSASYTVPSTASAASVSLTGRCGSGAPTKWIWSKTTTQGTTTPWKTTQTIQDSLFVSSGATTANVEYGVTACAGTNGDVCADEVKKTVTVRVEALPSGGGFCGNYSSVIETSTPWNVSAYSSEAGGLLGEGVFVVAIRVPDDLPATTSVKSISTYEIGAPAIRWMTISESKCDFRPVDKTGVNGPLVSVNNGALVTGRFYLPGSTSIPRLSKGKTYYLNVRNYYDYQKLQTCPSGAICDVKIEFR